MKIPPPQLPPFAVCFKSILSVHTETGNTWTHLIGCLAFFFIFLWFVTRPDTHTLFQMIAVMGLTGIVVSFWLRDKINFIGKLYRTLRADIFSCMGLNGSSTTTMVVPRPHRKLPPELDREVYLCFNPTTQRKFIWGLGWDFYAMFRHRLLIKTKRLCNPEGNHFGTNPRAIISHKCLNAHAQNRTNDMVNINEMVNILAAKAFTISGQHCREDDFPGTILYYFEVKMLIPTGAWSYVVLSVTTTTMEENNGFGGFPNSYAIATGYEHYECYIAGKRHLFELQGAIIQRRKRNDTNVYGCGLVLDPQGKLSIFFTLNGKLLGYPIPITPSVDRLFPAIRLLNYAALEANFGDDPAKPFEYDIKNCPGLGLTCI